MKLFALLFVCSLNASALTVRVVDQNRSTLLSVETKSAGATVGAVTIDVLEQFEIPYTGGVYGITSMFERGQDIDVISDTEMKAYGWCFSVDGQTPMTWPIKLRSHQRPARSSGITHMRIT